MISGYNFFLKMEELKLVTKLARNKSLLIMERQAYLVIDTYLSMTSTPSVSNYKSFQESWRVKIF